MFRVVFTTWGGPTDLSSSSEVVSQDLLNPLVLDQELVMVQVLVGGRDRNDRPGLTGVKGD